VTSAVLCYDYFSYALKIFNLYRISYIVIFYELVELEMQI